MRIRIEITVPDDAMAGRKAQTVQSLDALLPRLRVAIKGAGRGASNQVDLAEGELTATVRNLGG